MNNQLLSDEEILDVFASMRSDGQHQYMIGCARAIIAAHTAKLLEGVAGEVVAWIRFCSDGTYEGPIADCDRRIDDVRRKSGAWTPLVPATALASARSELAARDAEIAGLREKLNGRLENIAAIAHDGGLAGLSESEALTAIRRITIPHLDLSGTVEQQRQAVIAAMSGQAGEVGK